MGGGGRPPASASGSGSASSDARPWDVAAPLPRARVGHGLPVRPDAARARGDAARPRDRPRRRRRTSTSTSSSGRARARARSARRSRCPGRVMLVIAPIGGRDDWEALFHEAGHTEHYAYTSRRPADGGQAARRHGRHRGLGVALPAPRHRAGVAQPPARRAARREARERGRGLAALLRAPLLREAALRDRVLPGRRPGERCGRATRSC